MGVQLQQGDHFPSVSFKFAVFTEHEFAGPDRISIENLQLLAITVKISFE